jgi:hypothetical protein
MQLTRKQLKEIIAEEIEYVASERDEYETLVEGYYNSYEVDEDSVSKEALMDFLEVMEESKIPKAAFEAFMANLPEQISKPLLKEVVEE